MAKATTISTSSKPGWRFLFLVSFMIAGVSMNARNDVALVEAFTIGTARTTSSISSGRQSSVQQQRMRLCASGVDADDKDGDPNEIIARRIIVKGDVEGGYFRACVRNEATKFRKLVGTMSLVPSSGDDDDDGRNMDGEIYVEGKRRDVKGFTRWCKKASDKIGLSQVVRVGSIVDEEPTGLYDGFYVEEPKKKDQRQPGQPSSSSAAAAP